MSPVKAQSEVGPYGSQVFPTGWFQIGWSGEYKTGHIKPLRYFDRDLVCYRGAGTGRIVVLDAYCAHLGAHLGHQFDDSVIDDSGRERIEGDNIRCPWHGWCWSPEGKNVDIPYSDRPYRGEGPQPWAVREVNGQILLWHDSAGREPFWEPENLPECAADADYYPIHPWSAREWKNITMWPQQAIENAVDFEHLRYVHGHVGKIDVVSLETDGPVVRGEVATTFETRRGRVAGRICPTGWGVGLAAIRLSGIHDIVHLVAVTPVDHQHSDAFGALVVRRLPNEPTPPRFAEALLAAEHHQFERDMVMWCNAKWIDGPPFPREEAKGFRALRQWARQFYPDVTQDERSVR
jgi:phenylpropionate dioxygenase-like ring-hydroxylating dioxygenase large terminal subunit